MNCDNLLKCVITGAFTTLYPTTLWTNLPSGGDLDLFEPTIAYGHIPSFDDVPSMLVIPEANIMKNEVEQATQRQEVG